jgi:bacteriocin-like protein
MTTRDKEMTEDLHELTTEELESVSGGINPQPLPPSHGDI